MTRRNYAEWGHATQHIDNMLGIHKTKNPWKHPIVDNDSIYAFCAHQVKLRLRVGYKKHHKKCMAGLSLKLLLPYLFFTYFFLSTNFYMIQLGFQMKYEQFCIMPQRSNAQNTWNMDKLILHDWWINAGITANKSFLLFTRHCRISW